MKKKTVHVRVSEETRLGLQRLIYDMETAVSLGQGKRFWRQEELGTAELIAELLRRELAHRERSKKASRKGTRRRTALTPSDPPPIDPAEGVLTPPEYDEVTDLEMERMLGGAMDGMKRAIDNVNANP